MSQYTFRIWFTGLMHFVENKDPYAKCRLCVVLPRADQDPQRRQHTGGIYEVHRELACGKPRLRPGSPIGPYPYPFLDRHRVAFRITRTDDIPAEQTASMTFPYGFLHLQDIAGIFADENDQIVSRYPPDTVLAQILVEGGYSFGYDYDVSVRRDWDIPQTLTGYKLTLEVADPVFVEIPDVEKVEIVFYRLCDEATNTCDDEAEVFSQVLAPGSNGLIEIMAANSCRDDYGYDCVLCWDDLDFQWFDGNHLKILQIDRDFEYHYNLLHPATLEAIKKVLPKKQNPQLQSTPRFPVPESLLLEIKVAPHICLEDIFKPTPGPEPELYHAIHCEEELIDEQVRRFLRRRFPTAAVDQIDFLKDIVKSILLVVFGTGTGSGNDCLHTKAEARFLDLDRFISAPSPAVSLSVLHNQVALDRRMCFPPPGDPAYPLAKKQEEPGPEVPKPEPKKD